MQKWIDLFNSLEHIIDDEIEVLTEQEFLEVESALGVLFPLEYRKFCQVFGSCVLGEWIRIECPNLETYSYNAGLYTYNRDLSKLMLYPHYDRLLGSCYVFGSNTSSLDILFDMQSYSEIDKSCDIYWTDAPDCIVKIGRDFYEFVSEFCLGDRCIGMEPYDAGDKPYGDTLNKCVFQYYAEAPIQFWDSDAIERASQYFNFNN